MEPLPGANEFLAWLRERFQVLILSDTFYQFAKPLMRQLGDPTLFCHDLEVDAGGRVPATACASADASAARSRRCAASSFRTIAAGDSYNDTAMLGEADAGILYPAARERGRASSRSSR